MIYTGLSRPENQMPKTENDAAPKPLRGRPRDPARCQRILDAASSHFSAHGLERASVDAIAAGTLKTMLQGMIARGATIFLTSHVLEIVERLCSHVAIIHQGRLVAQGSLEELRTGVEAQTPAPGGDGSAPAPEGKMTLEQIFLRTVGGSQRTEQELSWLG